MRPIFPMLAMTLACTAMTPVLVTPGAQPAVIERERTDPGLRRKKRLALAQAPARFRRSKGVQAKPKRHTNRVTVSRRVRRRHRRAA